MNISIPSRTSTETPLHFNTTVPFTVGKTININQNVTSKGSTIHVDRVVATPSETRFYYSGQDKNAELSVTSVTIGGQEVFKGTGNGIRPNDITVKSGKPKESILFVHTNVNVPSSNFTLTNNLQNKTGTWVVNVSKLGDPNLNWQFTFNV